MQHVTNLYLWQAIKKETSGRFEDALLAVVQCTCYPARFFAQVRFLPSQFINSIYDRVFNNVQLFQEILDNVVKRFLPMS